MYHFERFLTSPDFLSYLANTLKLSVFGLLWGFPAPILLAFLLIKNAYSCQCCRMYTRELCSLVFPPFGTTALVWGLLIDLGIVRILLSPTGMINMLLGTNYNFMTMPHTFSPLSVKCPCRRSFS